MSNIDYKQYLRSKEWDAVRRIALAFADNKCALCASGASLQVHHKHYRSLGLETLDDVIVLCGACHATHHGKLPQNQLDIHLINHKEFLVDNFPGNGIAREILNNSTLAVMMSANGFRRIRIDLTEGTEHLLIGSAVERLRNFISAMVGGDCSVEVRCPQGKQPTPDERRLQ